jgi:hypothetical protein
MHILSSIQILKNITGAKNSDKDNKGTLPLEPKQPIYSLPGLRDLDLPTLNIHGSGEHYVHAGIEKKVNNNWSVEPNAVLYYQNGLHTPAVGINVIYRY